MPHFVRMVLIVLAVALFAATAGVSFVRWADIHYAGETLKDAWGRWRFHEDWGKAPVLGAVQNYRWVSEGMLLSHALGGAGGAQQNTLGSMDKSLALGMNVLEIDLWLDNGGQLRCHHGPEAPAPLTAADCTWDKALAKAIAADAWLVLDIKTDFQATAQALLKRLPAPQSASKVIFQLYQPAQVAMFIAWQKQYPLAGPLITAYTAKRSMRHIAQNAQRIGVQVLTLPLYRRAALKQDAATPKILVHPIHNCDEARAAAPATGYYVNADSAILIRQQCSGLLRAVLR